MSRGVSSVKVWAGGSAAVAASAALVMTGMAAAQTTTAGPVALELERNAETATWKFNENERSETKKRTFVATPPLKDSDFSGIDVEFPNDIENEDGRSFPQANVTLKPLPAGPPDSRDLRVEITLDSKGVPAGRYTGTLKVKGTPVAPATLSVVATIRDSKVEVGILGLIGFLVGLGLKAIVDVAAARKKNKARGAWKPYWRKYVRDGAFWSNVLVGGAAAAGAIAVTYLTNDTWGAGSVDELKVIGIALSTAATGATLTDAVKPFQPAPSTVGG